MKRWLAVLFVLTLLAGCGQRSGVHQRFVEQFQQTVAASTAAHGASAKTREGPKQRPVVTKPERVPGGHRILVVHVSTSSASITWPQWAALLLDRLDAPRCANNVIAVVAWEVQEGTSAGWNPLATTYDLTGSTLFNSAGVKNYASLEQGLDATLLTLQQGFTEHGYGAIVQSLRGCADPVATAIAINASDWCRGCAGGAYVTSVVPNIVAQYVSSLRRP